MSREYCGSGQSVSDGILNALIKVLEGLVCAVDEALHAFLALIEDPGRPRQSLGHKTTKAGRRAIPGIAFPGGGTTQNKQWSEHKDVHDWLGRRRGGPVTL